jgi:formyltetrahydrofolate-dependent phosphoribosylglycinamide formyltransferase
MATPARPLELVVLISGTGRTLDNFFRLIEAGELRARIALVVASRADARGLDYARTRAVPTAVVRPREHRDVEAFSRALASRVLEAKPDLVLLAGFLHLFLLPRELEGRVMNIHPALLPSFGGPGLYGMKVHEAVHRAGVKVTGCTVHFADHQYDHGPIILQRTVAIADDDTPETIAHKVFEEELIAYPEAVRLFAARRLAIENGRVRIAPAAGQRS